MSSLATPFTRADLVRRDGADPLARMRDEFDLPAGTIYLDGNSLGARPRRAMQIAERVLRQEWGQDLVRSWTTPAGFSCRASSATSSRA